MSKIKVLKNYFVRFVRLLATYCWFAAVLLLFISSVSMADPLDSWSFRDPFLNNGYGNVRVVAYGNNIFLAVGDELYLRGSYSSSFLSSSDGIRWTSQNYGISTRFNAITYGNNTFVAVGDNGKILTTTDGVTFTAQVSGATDSLYGITYGNKTFVAVGDNGITLTSPDGIAWTKRTSSDSAFWYDKLNAITYGNGTFVATGRDRVITSPDGITWTEQRVTASGGSSGTTILYGITYANDTFVAVADFEYMGNDYRTRYRPEILTSPDGVTWTIRIETKVIASSSAGFRSVTYGNNTFVAVGLESENYILTSPDGVTWTPQTSGNSYHGFYGVTYGNSNFVAVGDYNTILTSPDGVTWTERTTCWACYYSKVIYGNNTFVAVGDYNTILTSPDGVAWTQQKVSNYGFDGITYGNNTFVGVSDSRIYTSPDGIRWTNQGNIDNIIRLPKKITYGNGTFVAVGYSLDIATSPDGVIWTKKQKITDTACDSSLGTYETHNAVINLYEITHGNNTFVAVGYCMYNGSKYYLAILTSPDGVTWTTRKKAEDEGEFSSVTYGNNTFVAVGFKFGDSTGILYTSPDGVTWTKRTSWPNRFLYGVTYGKDIFIAVGAQNTILTSPDGVTWAKRISGKTVSMSWDSRPEYSPSLTGVAYGNKIFVVVGLESTLYTSDPMDGSAISAANDNCNVKLEATNNSYYLTVPIVTLSGTTAAHYNAELVYSATTDNKIWFKIANVAPLADISTFSNCAHSTLTSLGGDWVMHLGKVDISGTSLWADLTYTPTTDGNIWLTLTNSGGY